MKIDHKNICIRNAEAADCEQLAKWWNDGAVMAHAGFPKGLGTTAEKIKGEIATDTDDTRRRLIIELDHSPIGEMSYSNLGGGTAEIGIKICDFSKQEQGIGRTALSMLINTLFENGFTRIILDTNLKNLRAQHVYELLGFKKLRINKDSWTDQLGESQSSVDYELIQTDFKNYAKD